MRGVYSFYRDGELVARTENLITDEGKLAIVKYLAGRAPGFAESMVFGSGTAPAQVTDRRLEFEFDAALIDLGEFEVGTPSKVIYRAAIDESTVAVVHEVGLKSVSPDADNDVPSNMITRFDESQEDYVGGTVFEVGRIGHNSIGVQVDASGAGEFTIDVPRLDMSEYLVEDEFSLAYDYFDGNVSSIEIRFVDEDGANYRHHSFTPQEGYNIYRFEKGDMQQQGSPDWGVMRGITIVVTGSEGGSVAFDGLRVENVSRSSGFGLVSRAVLDEPIAKTDDSELQVEYAIDVMV